MAGLKEKVYSGLCYVFIFLLLFRIKAAVLAKQLLKIEIGHFVLSCFQLP